MKENIDTDDIQKLYQKYKALLIREHEIVIRN